MATQFGMTATTWRMEAEVCHDAKCGRLVAPGDPCFIDANGDLYCDSCGRCERYARKKQQQRNQVKEN